MHLKLKTLEVFQNLKSEVIIFKYINLNLLLVFFCCLFCNCITVNTAFIEKCQLYINDIVINMIYKC